MENHDDDRIVAETILEQIGRVNLLELGAKDFVYGRNFLMFHTNSDPNFNKVVVEYDEGSDLYNVQLWKVGSGKSKKFQEQKGVYCNELSLMLGGKPMEFQTCGFMEAWDAERDK